MSKLTAEQKQLEYEKKNPEKARIIKRAVKRALTEYKATFDKLAKT